MALNGNNASDVEQTAEAFQRAEVILKSMQTPQAIRELPVFDGNPVKLHSFIRSVDHLIPFLSALENTPFYNVWLQSIRAKIVGDADQILEIYGTPLTWNDIKGNLIAYYNDKRDCVTLTRELFQLQQITTIEKFYSQVQNLLSLLINNTNISIQDTDLKTDRIETHKENALQVFLAGLKEPIGGNVRARKPSTLKEAFDACIEERNFQAKQGLKSSPPFLSFPKQTHPNTFSHFPPVNFKMPMQQTKNFNDNFNIPRLPVPNKNVFAPKPFPTYQMKPTPMEVDRSILSKQTNYANRQNINQPPPPTPKVPFQTSYLPQNRIPYQPPYLQQNNRNFFQQTGPPKFYTEELHNTGYYTDGNEYYYPPQDLCYFDPEFFYYQHYFPYPEPDQNEYYDDHEQKTEPLAIEPPNQIPAKETSSSHSIDDLNFQRVINQNFKT